jgi:hypothetical protein
VATAVHDPALGDDLPARIGVFRPGVLPPALATPNGRRRCAAGASPVCAPAPEPGAESLAAMIFSAFTGTAALAGRIAT